MIKDVRKKELKDRIVKQAISSVRRNHKVDEVSLLSLSKELEVDFSEVTKYYTSMEDIFFEQQKKNTHIYSGRRN